MKTTVSGWCDRAGHSLSVLTLVAAALVAMPAPAAAQRPGKYVAPRFDVAVRVADGGHLDVTETITFEFQTGSFRRVWREIPAARTDGVQIAQAFMDGRPFTAGEGPGHVKITGRNRIKVEWQFEPVGPSTHTFELRYRANGVVYREGDRDVVRWRLLPSEHKYPIAASRSTISAPGSPIGPPLLETNRVGTAEPADSGGAIQVLAADIRSNGWILAEARYPAGSLISGQPDWRQRHDHAAALAPRWMGAAGGLFVTGLVLLAILMPGYPRPSVNGRETTTMDLPEPLPAALAAVLAARGTGIGYQSIATIFDLAERGVLTVRELPRRLGVRSYELAQVPGARDLQEHEREVIAIAFAGRPDVSLSKARARLARAAKRFTAAVNRDLAARGYLDPDRKAVRDRMIVVSVGMLIASAIGSIAMATLIPRFEGWPFLLPFALCAAGIIGIIMAASMTPLSDSGLVQASRWRGFRRHLKSTVDPKSRRPPTALNPRWIVYGIAVGLASQWARYLKAYPGEAPRWFQAAAHDDRAAFAAFVGTHAGASSGSAGGGSAAGGGGSGAG